MMHGGKSSIFIYPFTNERQASNTTYKPLRLRTHRRLYSVTRQSHRSTLKPLNMLEQSRQVLAILLSFLTCLGLTIIIRLHCITRHCSTASYTAKSPLAGFEQPGFATFADDGSLRLRGQWHVFRRPAHTIHLVLRKACHQKARCRSSEAGAALLFLASLHMS